MDGFPPAPPGTAIPGSTVPREANALARLARFRTAPIPRHRRGRWGRLRRDLGRFRRPAGRPIPPPTGRLPIDPRFARRWIDVRRQESRRRLRILAAVGAAVAVIVASVGLLFSPWLSLHHVRISAAGAVSRSEVLAVTGLAHSRPLFDINTANLADRLDAVVDLGGARVSRSWPDTVVIEVTQRTPVAMVAQPTSPNSAPMWASVDATGRVLADSVAPLPGLPVVQNAGPVPAPGQWLAGSAGPTTAPLPSIATGVIGTGATGTGATGTGAGSGRSLVDLAAAPDSSTVPTGTAAALGIAAALPASLRSTVISVKAGPGGQLTMAVLPPTVATGAIPVNLGDGSLLNQKLTALAALLTQENLSGATAINLTVPDRPAVAGQS